MQINSWWVLRIGENYLELEDPCYCTKVGAWILMDCVKSYGDNADAISCYNTGKSLKALDGDRQMAAKRYVKKVINRYNYLLGDSANDK